MCQDAGVASPSKAPRIFLLFCLNWGLSFVVFCPRETEKENSNVLAHFSPI